MISGVVVSVVALWIESLPTSVLSTLTGMDHSTAVILSAQMREAPADLHGDRS